VQNRPINDQDYDSPSLEVAYAGNMRKSMPHICGIPVCSICATYMHHIYFVKFRTFSRIFCLKKFRIF